MRVICFGKKMRFQKPWNWDELSKTLTLLLPGVTVAVSQDYVDPSPSQVLGGFVISKTGLDATLVFGGDTPKLVRLEIKPNSVGSPEPEAQESD